MPEEAKAPSMCQKIVAFVDKQYFLLGVVILIVVASLSPEAGAKGGKLQSKITSGWIAVCCIFFLSGLSLKTKELIKAALYCKINSFVQIFSLGFIPFTVYGLVKLLMLTDMNEKLLNGLLISACLPTTVSMCVMLTKTGGGNDAVAIFNAAFGNLLGIFVTPLLILLLVGSESDIPLKEVLVKLVLKIFVPLIIGQIFQYFIPGAAAFNKAHKKEFKRAQETLLLWIVYTTFCQTFHKGSEAAASDFIAILFIVFGLYVFYCIMVLFISGLPGMNFSRRDRVALLFCATHKTVAAGIPLLNTIFDGHKDLGMFVLPLLIWHPLQLFMGSFALGRLNTWVDGCEVSMAERAIAEGDAPSKKTPEAQEEAAIQTKELDVALEPSSDAAEKVV
jgi:sodium/bile acid cotransporter 7